MLGKFKFSHNLSVQLYNSPYRCSKIEHFLIEIVVSVIFKVNLYSLEGGFVCSSFHRYIFEMVVSTDNPRMHTDDGFCIILNISLPPIQMEKMRQQANYRPRT